MAVSDKKSSVDRQIDENLKRVFEDATREPLPDRFTDLIAQLREKEKGKPDDA